MICRCITCVSFILAMAFPSNAYPTMDQAQTFFPVTTLLTSNQDLEDEDHLRFISSMSSKADPFAEQEMENYILTAITSAVVTVSTNAVDVGITPWQFETCGVALENIGNLLRHFPTNSLACEGLARYIGTLCPIEFPRDLIPVHEGVHVAWIGSDDNLPRQQSAGSREEQKRIQLRVYEANNGLMEYRVSLFCFCNHAVVGCRKVMRDEEFANFTNRLVNLSGANTREKKYLFRYLK